MNILAVITPSILMLGVLFTFNISPTFGQFIPSPPPATSQPQPPQLLPQSPYRLPPTLGNLIGGQIPSLENITKEEVGNVTTMVRGPVTDYVEMTGNKILHVFYESPHMLVLHWEQWPIAEITNSAWPMIDYIHTHFGYNIDQFVISGLGTEGNSERYTIIMSK